MGPEEVVVVVAEVAALQSTMAAAATDMVAAVLDGELNDRSSCGLFHVRDEAQNCHLTDCESYRDDDIVVDRTTRYAERHVGVVDCYWLYWFGANADNNNNDCVFVAADYDNDGGGGGGCRNNWIVVQTIYYYCVYCYYLMHAPMHIEWKW